MHCSWGQCVKNKNAMPHAKPKWIASLPHAFASSCIFCGKLKNNIQYSFLSNTQHCCIELCQKSAPLCEECACTILTAMKAVHLKWSSAKIQIGTSHQVPIFTACFVSAPRLVEKSLTSFTQVLCFCPLLHFRELHAELDSALNIERTVGQQKPNDRLTFCGKDLIPVDKFPSDVTGNSLFWLNDFSSSATCKLGTKHQRRSQLWF